MKPIPHIEISDVEFRVQSITNTGRATILAYKDARYDMRVLDEVFGAQNWQRDYKVIDGRLYCGVGVYNETSAQWVWKWDVGTESNTEKEKGQASDAFKRACFNWGIGRELYDFPRINIQLEPDEFELKNNVPRQTWKLQLNEWKWVISREGEITLTAFDKTGKLRFGKGKNNTPTKPIQITAEVEIEISETSTQSELKAVWEKYPDHQKSKSFCTMINERKAQLPE